MQVEHGPAYRAPRPHGVALLEIVRDAARGEVVLPEFQRSFVWGPQDIKELLVSILKGYFIGTFLMLETDADDPMVPVRLIEGIEAVAGEERPDWRQHSTIRLVLDGQQRITSVFYALYEPEIPPRNCQHAYRFFLDIGRALDEDIEDAVVGVSVRDSRFRRYQAMVEEGSAVPFGWLGQRAVLDRWLYREQGRWNDEEIARVLALAELFEAFQVPVVTLARGTPVEDVVNIFERINSTGTRLTLFDLLAARLYPVGINLRQLWTEFVDSSTGLSRQLAGDEAVGQKMVLYTMALMQDVEPRDRQVMRLPERLGAEDWRRAWQEATQALVRACERLQQVYGVTHWRWMPYRPMLWPLAALLSFLEASRADAAAYEKLDRWYWGSVFASRYDQSAPTVALQDVRAVKAWLDGASAPTWLADFGLERQALVVSEQRSALYRGTMCLIVQRGALDFRSGQRVSLNQCEDDHIFPRSRFSGELVDTVLNRSLIWKETNRRKADKLPSQFMRECLEGHDGDEDKLMRTLATHFIDEAAYQALLRDDLEAFVRHRGEAIARAVVAKVRGTEA